MRIIGGNFKGKKISLPKDDKTRPLRDLVKESIFNLIEHSNKFDCSIKNSIILDLFSGTGSFGLECISRDAQKVIFVENYEEALHVLKKNTLTISSSLNQKAARPPKTHLLLDKAKKDLGYKPSSFEEGLSILDVQIYARQHED